jgi:hypothetical protein
MPFVGAKNNPWVSISYITVTRKFPFANLVEQKKKPRVKVKMTFCQS